jgi:hypothetical protein
VSLRRPMRRRNSAFHDATNYVERSDTPISG